MRVKPTNTSPGSICSMTSTKEPQLITSQLQSLLPLLLNANIKANTHANTRKGLEFMV